MWRGRQVRLNSLPTILSGSKETLSPSLRKKEPYILSSSRLPSHERSALFKFPMEEEARLFLQRGRCLAGIKLRELMGMGKEEKMKERMDGECLPSASFDFCVKIPTQENDYDKYTTGHHFVLDSKLYLARGGLGNYSGLYENEDESLERKKKKVRVVGVGAGEVEEYEVFDDLPWCKIYEVDIHNNKLKEVPADSNSIPQLPTPYEPNFLGNIGPHPDLYCLVWPNHYVPRYLAGLWVLSSSSDFTHKRLWKRLPIPDAILEVTSSTFGYYPIFVLLGKLYLSTLKKNLHYVPLGRPRRDPLVSFDPTTAKWARVDDDFIDTLFDYYDHTYSVGSVSLNKSVLAVLCRPETDPCYFDPLTRAVSLPAFLVKNKNDGVSLHYIRSFHECFLGLLPSSFYHMQSDTILVDLGNGTVCALFYTVKFDTPILKISVFKVLEPVEPLIAGQTLSIQVLLKLTFELDPEFSYPESSYHGTMKAFVFTPKK